MSGGERTRERARETLGEAWLNWQAHRTPRRTLPTKKTTTFLKIDNAASFKRMDHIQQQRRLEAVVARAIGMWSVFFQQYTGKFRGVLILV